MTWDRRSAVVAAVAIATMILLFVLDLVTHAPLVTAIGYAIPLALCFFVRHRACLAVLTAAAVVLTLLPLAYDSADSWTAAGNRAGVALTLVLLASILDRALVSARDLALRSEQLLGANRELERRELENGRQNEELQTQAEELQSQSEELERQSEELRVTNEELASWERMLEQLLELSRSLTAELPRSRVLEQICESLRILIQSEPAAAAIVLREGDEISVVCHRGFGDEVPDCLRIPAGSAFASLVIAAGQTGYLDDLATRPDLVVPQPRSGPRVQSVLAAPIRLQGRCMGTVEVYAFQPHDWSERQIATVESIAVQTSISLQSAELVDEILRERQRFGAAFRSVPFGMVVIDDPSGRMGRMNPAAAALFSLPADENVSPTSSAGRRLHRFVTRPPGISIDDMPLARALRGEEVHGQEVDMSFPDGRRVTLLFSAVPIVDAQGQLRGAVSAFPDITLQKKLQRELDLRRREAEEASLRKTRFLAAISHDLRTPAHAINLTTELLRRAARGAQGPPTGFDPADLVERIQANVRSMLDLVDDLLDVARFETGHIELVEAEFDLGKLISEEIEQFRPQAQEKRLSLVAEPLDSAPIGLRTDRVKLARILGNLLSNAIKFTAEGGVRVTYGLDAKGDVRVSVADTGIGIPPEHQARVFEEFSQLGNPERSRAKGSGLGLSICRRLVDAFGGTLSLESAVGQGSTVTVTLPAEYVLLHQRRTPAFREAAPASALSSNPRLDLRILLVEDENTTRESLGDLLVSEGATVHSAADGRSALEHLGARPVDVVLLDLMLPDLDGREVLRVIREASDPRAKAVIVLTGDISAARREEIQRLGAVAMLAKPVDFEVLMSLLLQQQSSLRSS
jgi:PAS domain S-box-containing protein